MCLKKLSLSYNIVFYEQTEFTFCYLNFLIYQQQRNNQLCYAQNFVFKPFHIAFRVLRTLSHKNIIEPSLNSKKWLLEKFCEQMCKFRRFISLKKQVFLVGFPVAFLRFLGRSKIRRNTSLTDTGNRPLISCHLAALMILNFFHQKLTQKIRYYSC